MKRCMLLLVLLLQVLSLACGLYDLYHPDPAAEIPDVASVVPGTPEPGTTAAEHMIPTANADLGAAADPAVSVSAAGDQQTYTVQPGDTLTGIAIRTGVPLPDLLEVNVITEPDHIAVGDVFIIPASSYAEVEREGARGYHIVQAGETLDAIAQRFAIPGPQLAKTNDLVSPDLLRVGQWLEIAVDAMAPTVRDSRRLIIVDLTRQRVRAYDNETRVLDAVASTGMPPYATQTGTFSVLNKLPDAYSAAYDLTMPYWLGIYWAGDLQNGFHALPIDAAGQRLWAGYLGRPASYGCITLEDADAAALYDWAEVGTPVVIWY